MKEKRQRVRRHRSPSLFLSHDEAVAMAAPPAATVVYIVYFLLPILLLLFYCFVYFGVAWSMHLLLTLIRPYPLVWNPNSAFPPRKSLHGLLLGAVAANDE